MVSINVQLSQFQGLGFFSASQRPKILTDPASLGLQTGMTDTNQTMADQRKKTLNPDLQRPTKESIPADVSVTTKSETNRLSEIPLKHFSPSNLVEVAYQGEKFQESRSISLEIETLEGDVVTIHLDQTAQENRAMFAISNKSGSNIAYQRNQGQGTNLDFSLKGNLNPEEQRAIKDLMHKLDKLADKFFQGDIKGAMQRLVKLGFNEQQLAGFSLDLNQSQSIQAVSAYYSIENRAGTNDLESLSEFTGKLRELPRPQLMKHPGKDIGKMLSGVIEYKAKREGREAPQETILQHVENLLEKTLALSEAMMAA